MSQVPDRETCQAQKPDRFPALWNWCPRDLSAHQSRQKCQTIFRRDQEIWNWNIGMNAPRRFLNGVPGRRLSAWGHWRRRRPHPLLTRLYLMEASCEVRRAPWAARSLSLPA